MFKRFKSWAKGLYERLVRMDDSPQRVALGFGVGVFLGLLPGTGPLAALAAAFVFRLNKAAALLGSVLTNTWLSFVTFALALKVGSALLGVNRSDDASLVNVLKPLLAGYALVGFVCALAAYLTALWVLTRRRKVK